MTNKQPRLSVTITLQDVYDTLCPSCKEKFLEHLATRAKGPPVKEALRAAFEAAAHPEPVEGAPAVDH